MRKNKVPYFASFPQYLTHSTDLLRLWATSWSGGWWWWWRWRHYIVDIDDDDADVDSYVVDNDDGDDDDCSGEHWGMLVNSVTMLWEGQRRKRGRGELKVTELAGTFLISRITYSRKYCKLPDWHQTFVCKLLEICLEFPVGRFFGIPVLKYSTSSF